MKINITTQKGFTLVEALVAITILLLVIIGPMTAAQKGTQNAYFAREQLTAVFLAQEAIEAVREIRDTKALDVYDFVNGGGIGQYTASWAGPLSGCNTNDCAYDPNSSTPFSICSTQDNNNCILLHDSQTGEYSYDSSSYTSQSPFTRKVRIADMGSGAWKVTSDVSWNNTQVFGGTPQNVTLETWVYDQYQRYE